MMELEQPGRVLVVDDDASVLLAIEGLLSLDFSVRSARDVSTAEAVLKTEAFDVVVTDFEMPGRSGLDLLRIVQESYPGTMVIILTGHAELAEVQHSEDSQAAVRVIAKPYDPGRLVQWIVRTVKLARLRQATHRLQLRAPRYAAMLRAAVPGTAGAPHLLTNLSVGGCFIRTDQRLAVGDPVELELSFPSLLEGLSIGGEVRWCSDGSDGCTRGAGIAFRNPSKRARDVLHGLVEQWVKDRDEARCAMRVVFLEPNDTLRQAYGAGLLRSLKPEVVWLADPEAVPPRVAEAHTHLVIIDVESAQADVPRLLQKLRRAPGCEQTPVVLLERDASASPPVDPLVMTITKPIAIEGLVRTVRTLLAARKKAAGLGTR